MTESEWMACTDPVRMLGFLEGKASDRKLRLFAVACCRDIGSLIRSKSSWKAVEASEDYADSRIRRKDLLELRERARQKESDLAQWVVMAASRPKVAAIWVAQLARDARDRLGISMSYAPTFNRSPEQCGHLRDLFGPLPFRAPSLEPRWVNLTVLNIAQAIYDERRFQDMPILADALEEVGCTDQDILQHCRRPRQHIRGCWSLDLLLGKE